MILSCLEKSNQNGAVEEKGFYENKETK